MYRAFYVNRFCIEAKVTLTQLFESTNLSGFSATDFQSWLFGSENFPGLSRNGPQATNAQLVITSSSQTTEQDYKGNPVQLDSWLFINPEFSMLILI